MQSGSWRHDRYYREASPASRTPLPSTSSPATTLPPISSVTRGSDLDRGRKAHASTSSSSPPHTHRTSIASLSSPSSSKSLSSRSSPPNEPVSPREGEPLLAYPRPLTMAAPRSPARRTPSSATASSHHHLSTTGAYAHSHHRSDQLQHSRHLEDGSHLWGDGMKGIWNSLTGAPHGKSRSPRVPQSSGKGEHLEPVRASEVEAATSIWDVPRDTIAMTMGFHGNYEDQPFQQHHVWQQQQQQQQQSQSASYPAAEQHQSYSSLPAPSGLAGGTSADGSRSRGNSDVAPAGDRHYSRSRPSYQHGRSSDSFADAPHSSQWWPAESHAAPEDAPSHYGNRRLQPPPLPETRTASRPAWTNPGGFEIGGYEFPQSTLGKRQYDEDAMAGSAHGAAGEAHDSATRRYSLAANMSFSRPSAPISGMMSGYRPYSHSDPRRPSLPSDQYGAQQSPAASSTQRSGAGYPSAQWSPWSQTTSHSGVAGSMSTSSSSPNPAWRDTSAGVRYGIEAGYPSPSGLAGTVDKRQQRDRSSSSASAVQQANVLANTPFHITTDIVLRAPAGSKMEDVYYDQHCELRTGMADPPKEDFEVENEEDRPRRQTDKLRFPGDLYTPRWVRGSGNAREAWCDRCESGNWLQLKNSQYWYDQVHKHGISSVSGLRFTAPTHLKVYADAAGTVEAKCHQCKEWVLICTAKRRRNFAAFFKHAHACHSYRKASAVGNGPYVEHNPGGHRNGKKGEGSG